jgi:hypothetical protein
MKQINVSIPDQVEEILRVMAEESGQSLSSLAAGILIPGTYEEASRRFKGKNYLKSARGKQD